MKDQCRMGDQECYYNVALHNCVNFIQTVLEGIGMKVDYRMFFRDEQLGHGYLEKILRGEDSLDDYAAAIFSFIQTRDMPTVVENALYEKFKQHATHSD